MGIGRVQMQRGGQGAVLQAEHGLHQARHAGSRLQMAQVALDRSDRQRPIAWARLAIDLTDRHRLDRITHRSAGAMRLDEIDLLRRQAAAAQHSAHQLALTLGAGNGDALLVAGTIAVGAAGQDHRLDRITIGQCPRQRLEKQHRAAFGTDIAIPFGIENLAAPLRREHRSLGEAHEWKRMQQQIDPTHQCRFGLAAAQTVAGMV